MSTHYTAVLEVHKVINTEGVVSRYAEQNKAPQRETAEVARIVLRADSLDRLQVKIAAHVELIEEG